jgi:hypothetical protein
VVFAVGEYHIFLFSIEHFIFAYGTFFFVWSMLYLPSVHCWYVKKKICRRRKTDCYFAFSASPNGAAAEATAAYGHCAKFCEPLLCEKNLP